MINNAIELGELPKSYNIMNRVEMPDESVLTVETKEIQIMPPEHQQLVKEIAMEYRIARRGNDRTWQKQYRHLHGAKRSENYKNFKPCRKQR